MSGIIKNSSNTIPKQLQGKGFKPGDPRINRKGRPKSFDALRALGLAIANEKVSIARKKIGDDPVSPELANLTVAELVLRKWAFSKDGKMQKDFLEIAYGKVPMTIDAGDFENVTSVEVRIIKAQ